MVFLYIVKCKDNSYYTGITSNIENRILQHDSGVRSSLQKSKRPVELVYFEKYTTRVEAAIREKEIKGWSRVKKERLINVYIESLH